MVKDTLAWRRILLCRSGHNRSRGIRAFTVIEVLVFSTILLLLFGSIALVVQGGLKYMRTGTAYQDAQRQVFVGMKMIREDLSNSTSVRREPVSPMVDSDHIIFASPIPNAPAVDWTYDGTDLEYYSWICYFHDPGNQELVRVRVPFVDATLSRDLVVPPPLSDFQSPPTGSTTKVIARGVDDLRFNDGETNKQIRVRLSSTVATGTNKSTTVVSASMVTLPNS